MTYEPAKFVVNFAFSPTFCESRANLRIMPVVMNIGEAAGIVAAMSLPSGNVRDIDTQALRAQIREVGGALEALPRKRPVFG